MLHEEFAPASRPRTESLFPFAPSPSNRPQSVSQSLSAVPHLRLSRVLLSTFSPSYPALPPSPFYLLFRRYQSAPTALELSLSFTLLFPPPHSHENFFLFYAALCRCSCLLTHSLLRVFSSFTRGVCLFSLLPPFRARGKRSRAPIHPLDFSLSHLSNFTLPTRTVTPFICLPSPSARHRAHHPPSPPHI